MKIEEVKMRAGKYYLPVKLEYRGDRIFLLFKYNKPLLKEVKMMEGRKWHGFDEPVPRKCWSIPITPRNLFQLDYLRKDRPNPYLRYDIESDLEINYDRPLMSHQSLMVAEGLTRKQMIWAAEMGTGKTLSAIELMERSGHKDWWWVGPRSAIAAAKLEFIKWNTGVWPQKLLTYEALRREIDNWVDGTPAPHGVIFDESSRAKTPTALRSQAAKALADGMREDHGDDCYVVLMSGTPAPKSPLDWWFQCEIACPGFLKEGSYYFFRDTMGVYEERQNLTGGTYPYRVCWRDNDELCDVCGYPEEDEHHDIKKGLEEGFDTHGYVKMKNEVTRLYKRLKGLVLVQFKKDCLDLPEKVYKIIECEPALDTLRAAELVAKRAPRVATALILLRELSDGFQYQQIKQGEEECDHCDEHGRVLHPGMYDAVTTLSQTHDVPYDEIESDPRFKDTIQELFEANETNSIWKNCDVCKGTKIRDIMKRSYTEVPCPKDDALKELLEDHEEYGRLVVYAGFEASVDRVVKICQEAGWATLRVDGRGCQARDKDDRDLMLDLDTGLMHFQSGEDKMVFVGHPGAAGMGLTLTASPSIVYFSNDFNGESRTQSEDRIHRPGMLGANIFDLIHLPTDRQVLENLKEKRDLELMSLGQLEAAIKETGDVRTA